MHMVVCVVTTYQFLCQFLTSFWEQNKRGGDKDKGKRRSRQKWESLAEPDNIRKQVAIIF